MVRSAGACLDDANLCEGTQLPSHGTEAEQAALRGSQFSQQNRREGNMYY